MRKFFYNLQSIIGRCPVNNNMVDQRIILLPDGLHSISDRGCAVEGGCYDGDADWHSVDS